MQQVVSGEADDEARNKFQSLWMEKDPDHDHRAQRDRELAKGGCSRRLIPDFRGESGVGRAHAPYPIPDKNPCKSDEQADIRHDRVFQE